MESKAYQQSETGATDDRVREHSAEDTNARIDRETRERLELYAMRGRDEITRRIEELDREWDVERMLQTNASTLTLIGLGLAASQSKKWLILPGIVLPFLFQHAVQGWCPPLPVMRRLGIRTRKEIDREKYALKALRGDFADVAREQARDAAGAEQSLQAAQA